MKYVNEYEIRVFGLKHSGQHAIINWIATLFNEPVYFFNNCGWNGDPHKTKRTRGEREGLENIFVDAPKMRWAPEEKIDAVKNESKKCMMYSYENAYIDRVYGKGGGSGRPATLPNSVGKSKNVFDVLILRDIYNLSSGSLKNTDRYCNKHSRIEKYWDEMGSGPIARRSIQRASKTMTRAGDDEELLELDFRNYTEKDKLEQRYKLAAREFLGETNYLKNKICISYNDWFMSKGYRELIAEKFGQPNNELSMNIVAGVGNRGSRFDEFKYDGKAHKMKVLERWKYFKNNSLFWEILSDWEEARDLSDKVFGPFPETDKYLIRQEQQCILK